LCPLGLRPDWIADFNRNYEQGQWDQFTKIVAELDERYESLQVPTENFISQGQFDAYKIRLQAQMFFVQAKNHNDPIVSRLQHMAGAYLRRADIVETQTDEERDEFRCKAKSIFLPSQPQQEAFPMPTQKQPVNIIPPPPGFDSAAQNSSVQPEGCKNVSQHPVIQTV
jgi:hypothetical protein